VVERLKRQNAMTKQLTKSTYNRKIAGVCGGIAEYFDVDPTVVRVAYVLLSLFSAAFPGILVYIILAMVMPTRY
jgi:phage shock protein C